jgi:uncharacterized membrane protein
MNIPPLHPAVVHLPIALVFFSVLADVCARLAKAEPRRALFRSLGFWSLVGGLAGAVLTIIAGYLDLRRATLSAETQQFVDLHMDLGWMLGILLVVLTAWRWLIWHRGQMTINTSYLATGFLVLCLTWFQGWYGGEMVYSYGAGVAATGQGTEPAAAGQSRLLAVRNALQPNSANATAIGGAESPGGTNQANQVRGQK